jgi:hypothetical protein
MMKERHIAIATIMHSGFGGTKIEVKTQHSAKSQRIPSLDTITLNHGAAKIKEMKADSDNTFLSRGFFSVDRHHPSDKTCQKHGGQ